MDPITNEKGGMSNENRKSEKMVRARPEFLYYYYTPLLQHRRARPHPPTFGIAMEGQQRTDLSSIA
jgi:hypothetical protein